MMGWRVGKMLVNQGIGAGMQKAGEQSGVALWNFQGLHGYWFMVDMELGLGK